MKLRPAGAELFHADRQTDRRTDGQTTKIRVAFLNFAKANNAISILLYSLDVSTMVNKKYGWNL